MPKYASSSLLSLSPARYWKGPPRPARLVAAASTAGPGTVCPNWLPSVRVTVLNDVMTGSGSVDFTVTVTKPAVLSRLKTLCSTSAAYIVAPGWITAVACGGEGSAAPRLRNCNVTGSGLAPGLCRERSQDCPRAPRVAATQGSTTDWLTGAVITIDWLPLPLV